MNMRDLIPWGRGNTNPVPLSYRDERDPFLSLHREVNRLFDDAFRAFGRPLANGGLPSFGSFTWPSVEISETDSDVRVTAEMPGLAENDIEVLLKDGMLTLRGEKRSETEDKERQFSERYYGRFERHIPLNAEIDEDRVDARFKNGVLTIVLPKTESARSQVKRIAIRS